jgi:hypothetical protein
VALKSLQTFPTEALKTPYFFNSLNGLLKLSGQAQKLKNNEVIPKVEIGAWSKQLADTMEILKHIYIVGKKEATAMRNISFLMQTNRWFRSQLRW